MALTTVVRFLFACSSSNHFSNNSKSNVSAMDSTALFAANSENPTEFFVFPFVVDPEFQFPLIFQSFI